MRNKRQAVSDTSSVHLLHVCHHQRASNAALLKCRQDSERVHADRSTLLVMTNFGVIVKLLSLPVAREIHRGIGSQAVSGLSGDDMCEKDGASIVLAASLNWLAGGKSLGWERGLWCCGAKDAETQFTALGKAVLELGDH